MNPNGRVPAIIDRELDCTIWESGAAVERTKAIYEPELSQFEDDIQDLTKNVLD